MSQPASGTSGLRKAAVLMVMLGEEAASTIYKSLSEDMVQTLTQEITTMERVSPAQALQILEEYHHLTTTQAYLAQGGPDYAKNLLVKAFGEETAQHLLDQVSRAEEHNAAQLESLRRSDPMHLAKFLEGEHPQTVALTLAHLDAKQASALLMRMPEDARAEAVKRLAMLRQFSPEMAQKVSVALHRRLQSLGEQSRRAYAGVKGVADMLNRLDPAVGKAILEKIESEDAKLALNIRNLMFTFEDLLGIPESAMREIMGALDKKTLAMALRGASEELKNYIFKAMSSRAVDMLKEDMELLGPVRGKDVNKAQMEVVEIARSLESQGKIQLGTEQEDEYVV